MCSWSFQTKDAYVHSMQQPHIWGGAPEILCFCNMTRTPVYVKHTIMNKPIEFLPIHNENETQDQRNISNQIVLRQTPIVLFWTGGHYSPD